MPNEITAHLNRRPSGRRCVICNHPRCQEIDLALASQKEIRATAQHFGVSEDAIGRHKKHMIELLARSPEAPTIARSGSIASEIERLELEVQKIYDSARIAKNDKLALSAIDRLKGLLEFRAKVAGALRPGGGNTITHIHLPGNEDLNARIDRLIQRQRPISITPERTERALPATAGE